MNPAVKKISFTGSTAVGKLLMKLSSDTVKRLSLGKKAMHKELTCFWIRLSTLTSHFAQTTVLAELGGNAPFIVFEDADIEQAVNAAIASKFRNAGQTCVCADRFIIHEDIEEEFIEGLRRKLAKFQVGAGLREETNMGPLISESAAISVKEKVDEAIGQGAECILGGELLTDLGPNFLQPTILRNVDPSSRIWSTETFGPVVAITTFLREEEAIDLANDSNFGLASYFCSKDMARVFRVAERLENGIVGINEGIISTATAPFGGVKESGFGREGSPAGIAEYLETKYIFLNYWRNPTHYKILSFLSSYPGHQMTPLLQIANVLDCCHAN
jgi:succinate-semialdehyde dehydrogenase/glutarate-semialdehyde dehydrogenase